MIAEENLDFLASEQRRKEEEEELKRKLNTIDASPEDTRLEAIIREFGVKSDKPGVLLDKTSEKLLGGSKVSLERVLN